MLRLAAGSRPSPLRRRILLLGLGLGLALAGNMAGQVRLNAWYGRLFDALAEKRVADFGRQLVLFVGIVAFLLVTVVAQTWFQQLLKVALREWLTRHHLDRWLAPGRPYRLRMTGEPGANPDQRIQEDTRVLTDHTVELGAGLLQAALLLVSFVGVLWALSGHVTFHLGGWPVTIPGYMVWCALGYAAVGSTLTWLVGRRLIGLNAERYAREAEFRFALVRVSESAESVALWGGERDERRVLDAALGPVVGAMRRLSGSIAQLTWITSGYGWLAILVPILAAAPGYFGGELTIGGLMMVVGAFGQVQAALRWFVDNFPKLADWRAALGRVAWLHGALDRAEAVDGTVERVKVLPHPRAGLSLRRLTITLRDGTVVVRRADAEIGPGERVLIVGAVGGGQEHALPRPGGPVDLGQRHDRPAAAGRHDVHAAAALPAARHPARRRRLPRRPGQRPGPGRGGRAGARRPRRPGPGARPRGPVGRDALGRPAAAPGLRPSAAAPARLGVPRRGHGGARRGEPGARDVGLRPRAQGHRRGQHRPPARARGLPRSRAGAGARPGRGRATAERGGGPEPAVAAGAWARWAVRFPGATIGKRRSARGDLSPASSPRGGDGPPPQGSFAAECVEVR